ncbi:MAG: 3-dehydroquinate synthase [Deltaproteobacteria bacterium]|nr:3-dehydroquinate synthase [Deltaproteobacteria bacterium]
MLTLDSRPVYLIGFMATGKTTVGRILSERLGRRFVDLDEEIERATGKGVPELFRTEGEAAFRRHEQAALERLARERGAVIACGGGTPCFGDNLSRMRATGVVVALGASIDEILARIGDVSSRPLLSGPEGARAAAEKLYRQREAAYRSAEVVVETGGRPIERIADECARHVGQRLGHAAVLLGERTYPIHVAPISMGAELVRSLCPTSTVAIVTDENVARHGHPRRLRESLEGAGIRVTEVMIPPGERHKTLAQAESVAASCVQAGLDRQSVIMAVGGGVVGDLAGFVAAVLFRGVRVVQVPTTLLAMIDSAIGGKTGVDLAAGKNLLGAFWQPRFVLCDPATLETLPPRELAAAFGEVVKYGLLGDSALFAAVESRGAELDLKDVIVRSARLKAHVVAHDELETGKGGPALARAGGRAILNLGHTVGHAIEAASGMGEKGSLLHGECVALGLIAAARLSARIGACSAALEPRVAQAVRRAGLPAEIDPWLRDDVLAYMAVDKKRVGGKVRFVVLEDVGSARTVELSVSEISSLLRPRRGE